jgi:uncharacterized membrane protein
VGSIVVLLSRDFLRLVLVALAVATPLAWYVMDRWLGNYSYQIQLGWWLFAVAGLLAFLTVSFQSIRAGLADPAKSLKSE